MGNIFKIYDYDVSRPAWSLLAGQVLKCFLMLQNNFVFNILHRPFVTTSPRPNLRIGWGIAGLMCGAITFRSSPQCGEVPGL